MKCFHYDIDVLVAMFKTIFLIVQSVWKVFETSIFRYSLKFASKATANSCGEHLTMRLSSKSV
jgi:hypothetical protein